MLNDLQVAWLLKKVAYFWQPVLSEFTRLVPQTTVLTANWPGFAGGYEQSFRVDVIGQQRLIVLGRSQTSYAPTLMYLSPKVVIPLLRQRPQILFTDGFSLWTLLVLWLKPWLKWRVVIIYDGSAPGVDHRQSRWRLSIRRLITRYTDAFISNSSVSKDYLTQCLKAQEQTIFTTPYLVTDGKSLLTVSQSFDWDLSSWQRPLFLYVGQIIPRKGLRELINACSVLQAQRIHHYCVLMVGDGEQRQELEALTQSNGLSSQIQWLGAVEYGRLGAYLQLADVFVLPTLEDVWGMVIPEAMTFGKPILCSQYAGAAELVINGSNGYCFDPHQPERLAALMQRFIDRPHLIAEMGEQSKAIMSRHTPKKAAQALLKVVMSLDSSS
ncbi:MAG: glycosyltransferase family 4 protein [Acaryochloris sp. RU_4_1]|nr:glycosyltransferase family 4 protein [Acaryochloris sp. RU_4_1]NJR54687.1 glycosyltransferase family 4 protein [Acaryochloris sp. CRU_2_0]